MQNFLIIMICTSVFCFSTESNADDKQNSLAVVRPKDVLKDGVDGAIVKNPFTGLSGWARKGVIGATEYNIVRLDQLIRKKGPSQKEITEFWGNIDAINGRIESLNHLGLFDWFMPEEWMGNTEHTGRFITGILYLRYKQENSSENIEKLSNSLSDEWSKEVLLLKNDQLPKPSMQEMASDKPKKIIREETLLPDGVEAVKAKNPFTGEEGWIRKGTVNALLNNVVLVSNFFKMQNSDEKKLAQYTVNIAPLLDSFYTSGAFHLFSPEEWISDAKRPGRIYLALLICKHYPDFLTLDLKENFKTLLPRIEQKLLKQEIEKFVETF